MRQHVAALFPLRHPSKNSFEVLRLGLGELGSRNPRISNTPLLSIRINLRIEVPTFEFGCLRRRGLSRANLPDPDIVDGIERYPATNRQVALPHSDKSLPTTARLGGCKGAPPVPANPSSSKMC
jgi:hypothetical protein